MGKIEENSYNCLEKNEQIFCLLRICHLVEIKAFQGDHSPADKGLTAFRSLNFCSAFFTLFPPVSSHFFTSSGRSHLSDRSVA